MLVGPDGVELFVDKTNKDIVKIRQISALHGSTQGTDIAFPLHEESDGSRQLLNLLPALYRLQTTGGVFVVDELERSMHPILARKFIEFVLKTAHASSSLQRTSPRCSTWTFCVGTEFGSQRRTRQGRLKSTPWRNSKSATICESTRGIYKDASGPFASSAASTI